jgi:hypothetical protein
MIGNTFKCPYCWSDVPIQASVCSQCARDLVLFKPLALKVQDIANDLEQLKAEVQKHAATLSSISTQEIPTVSLTYEESQVASAQIEPLPIDTPKSTSWVALCLTVLLTIFVIGFFHWVLLFIYDAPPLFLRLLTITLPCLAGYACARKFSFNWLSQSIAAILVGSGAVWLMLGITSFIDHVPLWPDNSRDWREAFEYTASIGLSFLTRFLIHGLRHRWAVNQQKKISLSILLSRDENGKFKIAEVTQKFESLLTNVAPLVSAGTALYSGLKIFIGN